MGGGAEREVRTPRFQLHLGHCGVEYPGKGAEQSHGDGITWELVAWRQRHFLASGGWSSLLIPAWIGFGSPSPAPERIPTTTVVIPPRAS